MYFAFKREGKGTDGKRMLLDGRDGVAEKMAAVWLLQGPVDSWPCSVALFVFFLEPTPSLLDFKQLALI